MYLFPISWVLKSAKQFFQEHSGIFWKDLIVFEKDLKLFQRVIAHLEKHIAIA